MTDKPDQTEYGPWNPGLSSAIPGDVLPLSTMFREENVETGFAEAHELSDFSGLSPFDIVVFRPERLIVHELLVRVTTGLSVPDGPDYEELGINLRAMVARIYDKHVEPELDSLKAQHEEVRRDITKCLSDELAALRSRSRDAGSSASKPNGSFLGRIFRKRHVPGQKPDQSFETKLAALIARSGNPAQSLENACCAGLSKTVQSIVNHRGSLVGDDGVIVRLAIGSALNVWGAVRLGEAIAPIFEGAAAAEGYRQLPAQEKPVIMNVKGASASGKSTIRPKQRQLAERLQVPWEDFALISPDYWRKFLLEYETLGPVFKYGGMLTGHELAIIDRKLDRHMAAKARAGTMPHMLIDRFRFDSFNVGDDQTSQLLTRFGDSVYMFFMITPPEATVERAYKRGHTTGRYKAVDDLLDHNVEAYTGMPGLFFSWALSSKKVHYEFLDNSVVLGQPPKTVAYGWNNSLIILDIPKLLDIERFRKINVNANRPDQIYPKERMDAAHNTQFLKQCVERIETIRFADQRNGRVYGLMENGEWRYRDPDYVNSHLVEADALAGLTSLGWDHAVSMAADGPVPENVGRDEPRTLGYWGER